MIIVIFFLFKQKTAYEMRISDWISDVCSSDLLEAVAGPRAQRGLGQHAAGRVSGAKKQDAAFHRLDPGGRNGQPLRSAGTANRRARRAGLIRRVRAAVVGQVGDEPVHGIEPGAVADVAAAVRSEEHTSELQSLMRISYAVFCLKK